MRVCGAQWCSCQKKNRKMLEQVSNLAKLATKSTLYLLLRIFGGTLYLPLRKTFVAVHTYSLYTYFWDVSCGTLYLLTLYLLLRKTFVALHTYSLYTYVEMFFVALYTYSLYTYSLYTHFWDVSCGILYLLTLYLLLRCFFVALYTYLLTLYLPLRYFLQHSIPPFEKTCAAV